MNLDKHGLAVHGDQLDGGDSLVRESLLTIFSHGQRNRVLEYVSGGYFVRHPYQAPWNNKLNCTKDQIKLGMAALWVLGEYEKAWSVLKNHYARHYFSQSFERDFVGTKKYPWPHKTEDFKKINVSKISSEEVSRLIKDHSEKGLRHFRYDEWLILFDKPEWRMFDFADPLLPNDDLMYMKAANLPDKYSLGELWHKQALKSHAKSNHYEENQMFSECLVIGTLDDYVKINTRWKKRSFDYWTGQNEIEYHDMFLEFMYKKGYE